MLTYQHKAWTDDLKQENIAFVFFLPWEAQGRWINDTNITLRQSQHNSNPQENDRDHRIIHLANLRSEAIQSNENNSQKRIKTVKLKRINPK